MIRYLTDYRWVLQAKFTDEKLKKLAFTIKWQSTLLDLLFWAAFLGAFTLNSYVTFIACVVGLYAFTYAKIGRLSMNWLIWHELTPCEKIKHQNKDPHSIVREMLEHNLSTPVFMAQIYHLKEDENRKIGLYNKEKVFQAINGYGYFSMLESYKKYEKSYNLFTKVTMTFFIYLNALLLTYCFNGQAFKIESFTANSNPAIDAIMFVMCVLVLSLFATYYLQFSHTPENAPADCADEFYLAEFINVITTHKFQLEEFKKKNKGKCLSVSDMMEFQEKYSRY